ncbi:mycothiol synthase [Nakamurella silvestris]|nr:mycothiol synthase [Nakamurella silvestris]
MSTFGPGATGWQRGLGDAADEARELLELVAAADGVAALSGHIVAAFDLPAGSAEADDYLLLRSDGRLAGIAAAHGSDPAELAVHPARRRAGLGTELVQRALTRSGAVWAHGDLPQAQALAARAGLAPSRTLLQMRRGKSDGPPVVAAALPEGVRIRTFVVGQDEEAFLGVNARAFAWHPEQGRLDRAGLEREFAEDWFDAAGFFLAVDGNDRVLGFHWTKVHPVDGTPSPGAEAGPIGEIYVLAVDPESPVRGLGGPLTEAGLRYLAERGLDTVMLYVEGDNTAALKLYRRFGFQTHLADVVYSPSAQDQ